MKVLKGLYGGMIGFVVGGNKHKIAKNLRKRVSSLKHTNHSTALTQIPTFESNHTKQNMLEIDIYHLFFEFSLS